jgi:hypothetical protein
VDPATVTLGKKLDSSSLTSPTPATALRQPGRSPRS